MPINRLNYLSFDFETGGLKPGYHEAIQIGAKVYGPNFEPIGGKSGEFCSLMKPLYPDRLDDKALEVNGKTREEIMAAPEQAAVWKSFIKWAEQWKVSGKGTFGGHPIPVGKNIRDFDLHFVHELNLLHAPKKGEQVIFNKKKLFDLEDELFRWFNFTDELEAYNMDAVRVYFGMKTEGAHDALVDAVQTGDLVMRYLKFYRSMFHKVCKAEGDKPERRFVDFRNCCAKKETAA